MQLRRLRTHSPDFEKRFQALLARQQALEAEIREQVHAILEAVRTGGDAALLEYTHRFDQLVVEHATQLEIPTERLQQAVASLSKEEFEALKTAADRIAAFAEKQKLTSWEMVDALGNKLGERITPLDRVGIYVPGGKAAYPSTVLMNAIPARVAGVREIVMVSPTPRGEVNELVLAAAAIAGVHRVFRIGGAQAVAALTYGTETIPKVDKIVGPGNRYVAAAKQQLFGQVGIDTIAGPSEVVVVADRAANPSWVALDLFAQAEHDEDAQAILISPERSFLDWVQREVERLLPRMARRSVIETSLKRHGAFIEVQDWEEACALVNRIAPEHLELAVEMPETFLPKIKHAGAIFLGHYSAEVLGDYCLGPNHVLPTCGTARFASPLGVYDFQKRTTISSCTPEGAHELARVASVLARREALFAHAEAAESRFKS